MSKNEARVGISQQGNKSAAKRPCRFLGHNRECLDMMELPIDCSEGMTSHEIAEFLGKKHRKIKREIRLLFNAGIIDHCDCKAVDYINESKEKRTMYKLNFQATLLVISGYDGVRRALMINRWLELEQNMAIVSLICRSGGSLAHSSSIQ